MASSLSVCRTVLACSTYLPVVPDLSRYCHFERNDEMMLGLDRDLNIVADYTRAATAVAIDRLSGSVREICSSGEASICFS